MTGSIQEKNGVLYTVIYVDGTHKWQTTRLPKRGNMKKAKAILEERLALLEREYRVNTKLVSFADFMLEWLEVIEMQIRPTTYHQYKLVVENSIVPYFQKQKVMLHELQPIHIQKYYAIKMKNGVGPNTIKHHHANIRKALSYALKNDWIPYNPADRVELPKATAYTGNFYTTEQIRTIFALVQDTVIETVVLLTATYGLRRSEAIGLKWSAVDFDSHTLIISHTVVGAGNLQVRSDLTKNTSSTRTLPLVPEIENHLRALKIKQTNLKKQLGNGFVDKEYICTWQDGRLLSPEYVSRKFKALIQNSDLPVYRFHDLRHSSASLLLAAGWQLKEIGAWLGHSSITTTNRYAHLQNRATMEMAQSVTKDLFG